MPDKSRRQKSRRPPQGKRRATIGQPGTGAQTTEAVQAREIAPRPKAIRPAPIAAVPAARPALISIPYVTREIRAISILAAVMLISLIAVSLLLAR
ncbi:MAG: hypothetical protein HY662_02625 [Chloroflexi bacterium]|nr:hypothetical protein [Chloroflexota bacterium]